MMRPGIKTGVVLMVLGCFVPVLAYYGALAYVDFRVKMATSSAPDQGVMMLGFIGMVAGAFVGLCLGVAGLIVTLSAHWRERRKLAE